MKNLITKRNMPILSSILLLMVLPHFYIVFGLMQIQDAFSNPEKSSATTKNRSIVAKELHNTKLPPSVPRQEQTDVIVTESEDKCRKQFITTMTLLSVSSSENCRLAKVNSEFEELLTSQFELIKRVVKPHASLFDDQGGKVKALVIPNILCQHGELIHSSDITLTTQMSTNKMKRLIALVARWNGPAVSVAVRVTSMDELRDFQIQIRNNQKYLEKVAFHLYFESRHQLYPQNILRNLALDNVRSDYWALFDVDLLPSPINMHQHLRVTFDRHPILEEKLKDKTVFVLPAWDVLEMIPEDDITTEHMLYPESKESVIGMAAEGKVSQFWLDRFPEGHRSTNYTKWMSNSTDVTYTIQVQDYGYEPYTIGAVKNMPRFHPHFRAGVFDKTSYFAELHYAKYKKEVLRDFFVFHVNHPRMPDDNFHELIEKNMVCVQYFLEHLVEEYGAGNLKPEDEVPGFERWKEEMEEGREFALSPHFEPNNRKAVEKTPSAIIVGTQKGGTQALVYYLARHPQVQKFNRRTSEERKRCCESEMHFFYHGTFQNLRTFPNGTFYPKYVPTVLKSYQWHWNITDPNVKVTFEKTPEYMLLPKAAHGIKSVVPFAKIIMVLRNPVDRAYSRYKMLIREGQFEKEKHLFPEQAPSFEECVEMDIKRLKAAGVIGTKTTSLERDRAWIHYIYHSQQYSCDLLVGRGLYVLQLRVWWKLYSAKERKEQFLILNSEDLLPDSSDMIDLRPATEFLGISEIRADGKKKIHASKSKVPMDNATESLLYELYEPFNEELRELLGREWENPWNHSHVEYK